MRARRGRRRRPAGRDRQLALLQTRRLLSAASFPAFFGDQPVATSSGGHDEAALGVDPNNTLLHETGEDALGFLVVTSGVTPVRRIFKINRVQVVRRMLGVLVLSSTRSHVCRFIWCSTSSVIRWRRATTTASGSRLFKRKFIFVGMLAFSILMVLAITSTSGWVRRLKKRWATLAPARLRGRHRRDRPLRLGPEVRHQRAAEMGPARSSSCWGFASLLRVPGKRRPARGQNGPARPPRGLFPTVPPAGLAI